MEDETDYPLQIVCIGEALDRCTSVILLSRAVVAEGIIERKRGNIALNLETVKPLHLKY